MKVLKPDHCFVPNCLLLELSVRRQEAATVSGRAGERCVWTLSSSCPFVVPFLFSFWCAAWPRPPAGLQTLLSSLFSLFLFLSSYLVVRLSSSCPLLVLLSSSCGVLSQGKRKLATASGRANELCPALLLFLSCHNLLGRVLLMFFYCLLDFLLSFFSVLWPRPISGRPPPVVVLFFCCPLLLFSSWRAPLMLSCCPFGVVRSRSVFVLLVCSCCFPSLILLSFVVLCCLCSLSEAGAWAAGSHHNQQFPN